MLSQERRLEVYALLESLSAYLKNTKDADSASRYTLRAALEFFVASDGCLAALAHGGPGAELLFSVPEGRSWDLDMLAGFIHAKHPSVPPSIILAPLRRRRRPWGVMALERTDSVFERGDGRALVRIAGALSETIERIDGERLLEVRSRIDRKIMEELRPKDLFYQILDGIRSLTRYDHSAALLIRHAGEPDLRLEAEQIAWHKAKSRRIGARLSLGDDLLAALDDGGIYGFDRRGDRWAQWHGRPALSLAPLLDDGEAASFSASGRTSDEGAGNRAGALLFATLQASGGALGVIRIASRRPGSFGVWEADLLAGFRTQAAVAIQNSLRTESLQARMLEAERKHAMADLARGVSHDVNNALGTALPLVQQMRADLRGGRLDAKGLIEDLEQVEEALQLCRRVFGGMLSFARNASHASAEADVGRAVRAALGIFKDGLDQRGAKVVLEIPEDLPSVGGGQSDLERIFFNLIDNARESLSAGGRLTIRARTNGNGVEILVEDTGRGIAPELLPRIQEPFFTTKSEGTGLGLSIVRSIVWQMNGDMSIESEVGRGTRVRIRLPGYRRASGGGP